MRFMVFLIAAIGSEIGVKDAPGLLPPGCTLANGLLYPPGDHGALGSFGLGLYPGWSLPHGPRLGPRLGPALGPNDGPRLGPKLGPKLGPLPPTADIYTPRGATPPPDEAMPVCVSNEIPPPRSICAISNPPSQYYLPPFFVTRGVLCALFPLPLPLPYSAMCVPPFLYSHSLRGYATTSATTYGPLESCENRLHHCFLTRHWGLS